MKNNAWALLMLVVFVLSDLKSMCISYSVYILYIFWHLSWSMYNNKCKEPTFVFLPGWSGSPMSRDLCRSFSCLKIHSRPTQLHRELSNKYPYWAVEEGRMCVVLTIICLCFPTICQRVFMTSKVSLTQARIFNPGLWARGTTAFIFNRWPQLSVWMFNV